MRVFSKLTFRYCIAEEQRCAMPNCGIYIYLIARQVPGQCCLVAGGYPLSRDSRYLRTKYLTEYSGSVQVFGYMQPGCRHRVGVGRSFPPLSALSNPLPPVSKMRGVEMEYLLSHCCVSGATCLNIRLNLNPSPVNLVFLRR